MRYFTPDLLERFRSKDDPVAAVASDEWEQRAEAYAEYLRSVHSQFPGSLRQLLDNYYLHDAWVVFAATFGRTFGVFVRLDTPPQESLALQYELVAEPVVRPHGARLPGHESSPALVCVAWLYDELEVLPRKWFRWRKTFRHSILLSNGLEVQLDFRDFHLFKMPSSRILVSGMVEYGAAPQVAAS